MDIHEDINEISEAMIEMIVDVCVLHRLPNKELYKKRLEQMLGNIVGRQFRESRKRLEAFSSPITTNKLPSLISKHVSFADQPKKQIPNAELELDGESESQSDIDNNNLYVLKSC